LSETAETINDIIPSQNFKFSNTYPFSKASYIRVISYPDRNLWDHTKKEKGSYQVNNEIVKNGKINFDMSRIVDNVKLTTKQADDIFQILYNKKCLMEEVAACYDPRHMILFYDSNDKVIEYIEFCFDCSNYQTSDSVTRFSGCPKKFDMLYNEFIKVGVKSTGDPKIEEKLIKELNE
jgi:hypothetical protein